MSSRRSNRDLQETQTQASEERRQDDRSHSSTLPFHLYKDRHGTPNIIEISPGYPSPVKGKSRHPSLSPPTMMHRKDTRPSREPDSAREPQQSGKGSLSHTKPSSQKSYLLPPTENRVYKETTVTRYKVDPNVPSVRRMDEPPKTRLPPESFEIPETAPMNVRDAFIWWFVRNYDSNPGPNDENDRLSGWRLIELWNFYIHGARLGPKIVSLKGRKQDKQVLKERFRGIFQGMFLHIYGVSTHAHEENLPNRHEKVKHVQWILDHNCLKAVEGYPWADTRQVDDDCKERLGLAIHLQEWQNSVELLPYGSVVGQLC